jgi:hypothetical protein
MLRALGGFERVFWLVDQTHSVNFIIVAHVGGALEPQLLSRALALVQARHPLLGAKIVAPEGKPAFSMEGVPPIALRTVTRESEDHWRREAEHELNTRLSWQEGPLMRAVLVQGEARSELLLTFHHSAGDGRSGMVVVRDILTFAAALSRGEEVASGAVRAPPSIEDLFASQVKGARAFWQTVKFVSSTVFAMSRRPRQLPPQGEAGPVKAGLLHGSIPADECERLREHCRKEGATVHGVICGAMLRSVAAQLDGLEKAAKARFLGCYSPVDLRDQFLGAVDAGAVGYFLGMGLTFHRVGVAEEPWPLARDLGQRLRAMKDAGDIYIATHFQSGVSRRWDLQAAARSSPPVAAAVSNLREVGLAGRFGEFTLEGVHFALASHAWGAAPVLTVATHQGILQLNMTYSTPRIPEEWARQIFERMLAELRAIARVPGGQAVAQPDRNVAGQAGR